MGQNITKLEVIVKNKSFWVHKNGKETLASTLVRYLCAVDGKDSVSCSELYYILDRLDAKERFADYWDYPEFYEEGEVSVEMIPSLKRSMKRKFKGQWLSCSPRPGCVCCGYHAWLQAVGDIEWKVGAIGSAKASYLKCAQRGNDRSSVCCGYGGLFRLAFSMRDYSECVRVFRKMCPAHQYYQDIDRLIEKYANCDYSAFFYAEEKLLQSLGGGYPDWISTSKTMMKAVVFSFLEEGALGDTSYQMIADYFEVEKEEIKSVAVSLRDNSSALKRILKYIEPRQVSTTRSIDDLFQEGMTENANRIVENIDQYEEVVSVLIDKLREFLKSGDQLILELIVGVNAPFMSVYMNAVVFSAALESIVDEAMEMPDRQLQLMRKFSFFCGYPSGGESLKPRGVWGRHGNDFFSEFKKIVQQLKIYPEPEDLVLGMRAINWYDRGHEFNYALIRKDMEWSMALLPEFIDKNYTKDLFQTREVFEEFLKNGYQFLEEKYKEAKGKQRWKSEEMLAKAIKSLFGKKHVTQHASPVWLSPQHLDIYLPTYNLAIEYMGKQHYESVDYFGGQEAFEKTVIRDKYKRELCERMGLVLVYVTYEEDIGVRARQIFEQYGKGCRDTTSETVEFKLT